MPLPFWQRKLHPHSPPQGLLSAKAGRSVNKAQSLVVNSIIKLSATKWRTREREGDYKRCKENHVSLVATNDIRFWDRAHIHKWSTNFLWMQHLKFTALWLIGWQAVPPIHWAGPEHRVGSLKPYPGTSSTPGAQCVLYLLGFAVPPCVRR